jgi:uncharacterized delta-60 repeat protein
MTRTLCLFLLLCPIFAFAQPGAVDPLFQTQISGGPVNTIAVQPDGKILVGGAFTNVNGVTKHCLARLNPDGSLDTNFNADVLGSSFYVPRVSEVLVQPDSRILVSGRFTNVAGVSKSMIVRLNSNGTIDSQFDVGTNHQSVIVQALCLQPDGKILALGSFTYIGGASAKGLARLNDNGSADTSFNSTNNFNGALLSPFIGALTLQPDGKILAGNIRLNTNGSHDTSFNCIVYLGDFYCDHCSCVEGGANRPWLTFMANGENGGFVLAGSFERVNNISRKHIARVLTNGSLDTSFSTGTGPNGVIFSGSIQSDGKIVIGGCFSSFNGTQRAGVARLHPNGTLDNSFIPATVATNSVFATAIQQDGRVIIGGAFTTVAGAPHSGISRLKNELLLYDHSWQPSSFRAFCATSTNRTYYLEYKNSLVDPDWNTATSQAGSGLPQLFTDNSATGSVRFYRIREE